MRNTSFAGMHCSLAQSLEVMGDWWSPLVLRDLYLGLTRFDQLVTDLGISRNLLTTRLETLMDGGLVTRTPYQDNPVRYTYALTEAGRELVPILLALTAWGDRWVTPEGGPPIRFTHTTCGKATTATVTCSECGEALHTEDVRPSPGPGGRTAPGTALIATVLSP
ncbi:transcriptional regulator, HxlR family [Kribbella flavida DSM 17836]|uniref:Transcriptional regulator, HxlR family n=1 Tax=Kribbella flavida (strain DSM 17836 / JCM 10339 / NBRC 14399) TaxID=479435 RepID=D2Q4E7_KRIFD|nr:helix-turn-helix domain-containing protein [Kribbella flavida]ADB32261.1 transcriptional regulator, HxlR family [Kribbella flavida DSM 17836]